MSIALRSLFTAATVLAFAAPLCAQQHEVEALDGSEASVAAVETAPIASEGMATAAFGPSAASVALMTPTASVAFDAFPGAMVPRQRTSHNVALMIVGGAGLIVGSVVGGDAGTVIMIGGGVVGLIGLYRYLQ